MGRLEFAMDSLPAFALRVLRRGLIWGAVVWAGFFFFAVALAGWSGAGWGLGSGAIFGYLGLMAGILTALQDSSQEN